MLKRISLLAALLLLSASTAFAASSSLVAAHDATWPPMEFVDSNKNIAGYSVDYTNAIGKVLGITITHKNVAWDGIFAGLASKRYDFVASSVTITEERAKNMDFTTPYYEVKQAVILPMASTATSVNDLKGKTLGAQIGTTGFFAVQRIEASNPKSFDEISLAMVALSNGRLDGVICDEPVAADFVLTAKKYASKFKIAFIIESAEKEYYGFAVAKGNKETLDLLNKGIEMVKAQGIEDQLRAKWFSKK